MTRPQVVLPARSEPPPPNHLPPTPSNQSACLPDGPHESAPSVRTNHTAYLSNLAAPAEACLCQDERVHQASAPPLPPPAPSSPLHVRTRFACVRRACYVSELCPCVLSVVRWDVPPWMRASEIVMRCQLDFSQLITGCTWGVSVSLTHSHMLFPVLIFQLGHVMLTSHSVHPLSLSLPICAL